MLQILGKAMKTSFSKSTKGWGTSVDSTEWKGGGMDNKENYLKYWR